MNASNVTYEVLADGNDLEDFKVSFLIKDHPLFKELWIPLCLREGCL